MQNSKTQVAREDDKTKLVFFGKISKRKVAKYIRPEDDDIEIFVSELVGEALNRIYEDLSEMLSEQYEDSISSKSDFAELRGLFASNLQEIYEASRTLKNRGLKHSQNWYKRSTETLASLLSSIEKTKFICNPDKKVVNGDMYYYAFYDAVTYMDETIFALGNKYLHLNRYALEDRSAFSNDFQIGFALRDGEDKKYHAETISCGYIDDEHNILKEMIYIRPQKKSDMQAEDEGYGV